MVKTIIDPIDKHLLKKELTPDRFVRATNKGGNEIYDFTAHDSPNLMLEVARLREVTYRAAGGGTGAIIDIDHFDTSEQPYRQLIVWNPEKEEIIGGYRYIVCNQVVAEDLKKYLSTACYFQFSPQFVHEFLPFTIELGRAFVQPVYQASLAGNKSLYALDNLWDGMGTLIVHHPEIRYFFGKITSYRNFNSQARDIILHFMNTYFPDTSQLMQPIHPLEYDIEANGFKSMFLGSNFDDDFKFLVQKVRQFGESFPPMFSAYINLSSTMKTMGTTKNFSFGDVDETAILVTINDIYPHKLKRHVESYHCSSKLKEEFV